MPITRTVEIVVRHSADCKDRQRGTEWRKCNCRKSLVVYDGASKKTHRISAGTRSWEKAEKFKTDYLNGFDPDQQELKRLRAAEQQKQKPIDEVVELYLTDMAARLGDGGTVSGARHLLDSLTDWLAKQVPRPIHIAEITPALLIAWRSSWTLGDLTAAVRWSAVRTFFNFCENQGWVPESPARRIRPTKVARGGRPGVFTDAQYTAIVEAAHSDRRTHAFVELMRWAGMAITDAVLFRTEMIDADGVLRYRRHKSDELAIIPLPAHVIVNLRDVPLGNNAVGPAQPFRSNSPIIKTDVRLWQRRLTELWAAAGVTDVQTDSGTGKPHSHCLRDSFAVWNLRHGVPLMAVAKMLGHSSIKTTEQSYAPWVRELEAAHIAEARRALVHATPKPSQGRKVVNMRAPSKSA
jgi:integrase/recombinase XerD